MWQVHTAIRLIYWLVVDLTVHACIDVANGGIHNAHTRPGRSPGYTKQSTRFPNDSGGRINFNNGGGGYF